MDEFIHSSRYFGILQVIGHLEHASFWTNTWLALKCVCHPKIWTWLKECLPKALWRILKILVDLILDTGILLEFVRHYKDHKAIPMQHYKHYFQIVLLTKTDIYSEMWSIYFFLVKTMRYRIWLTLICINILAHNIKKWQQYLNKSAIFSAWVNQWLLPIQLLSDVKKNTNFYIKSKNIQNKLAWKKRKSNVWATCFH